MFTKEQIVSYIENEAVRPLSEEELAECKEELKASC